MCLNFTGMRSIYGISKSGMGMASMGVMRLDLMIRSIVPFVMAGVLDIYGLIMNTWINPKEKSYYLFDDYVHLSSGLACGLSGLAADMAIGIVDDDGVNYVSNFKNLVLFILFKILWSI